jgi:hypothetical protein
MRERQEDADRMAAAQARVAKSEAGEPMVGRIPDGPHRLADARAYLAPTRKGFLQGYNAQFAVTGDQIIVVTQLGQNTNDMSSFVPMMHAAERASLMLHAETGRPSHVLGVVLADAGDCSDRNLAGVSWLGWSGPGFPLCSNGFR